MNNVNKPSANNTPTSNVTNRDSIWWALVFVLIVLGVAANYYFSNVVLAIRLAGWIILACLALVFILQTVKGKKFLQFAKEARIELYKVVWPTRQEATHTTMVITALVVLMALILWGVDSIFMWFINWLAG